VSIWHLCFLVGMICSVNAVPGECPPASASALAVLAEAVAVFSAKTLRQGPFADCVDNRPAGLALCGLDRVGAGGVPGECQGSAGGVPGECRGSARGVPGELKLIRIPCHAGLTQAIPESSWRTCWRLAACPDALIGSAVRRKCYFVGLSHNGVMQALGTRTSRSE
jgi:hypothetical protein